MLACILVNNMVFYALVSIVQSVGLHVVKVGHDSEHTDTMACKKNHALSSFHQVNAQY